MYDKSPNLEQFEQELYSGLLEIIPMAKEQKLKRLYEELYRSKMGEKPWEDLSQDLRLVCAQTYTLSEICFRFQHVTSLAMKLEPLLYEEQL